MMCLLFYSLLLFRLLFVPVSGCTFQRQNMNSLRRVEILSAHDDMLDICRKYDFLLIDQWGVLHDGKSPYENVFETLSSLKMQDKKMILLSNSSKRKSSSVNGLRRIVFNTDFFLDIITSGELGWQMIHDRNPLLGFELTSGRKPRVFVIGNGDDDIEYVESANCQLSSPEDADFVLARGTFSILYGHEDEVNIKYECSKDLVNNINPWLERCAKHQLPMLVTNPDMLRPGSNDAMPGLIAEMYSNIEIASKSFPMPVHYIGKPHSIVYDECMNVVKRSLSATTTSKFNAEDEIYLTLEKSLICGIGDSLDHDIKGASIAGIDSIWIRNGVHCLELSTTEGSHDNADEILISSVLDKYQAMPTFSINSFGWKKS